MTRSDPAPSPQLMRTILGLLAKEYGKLPTRRHGLALDLLIRTILSQNTNDRNRDRAYENLKKHFKSWAEVAEARPAQISSAIRVAGLSNIKAGYIRGALRRIRAERGPYSLEFLKDMPVEEGMAYLTHMPGVGVKTAAVVLLFSFGKPAFPVDTHIYRVTRRLGLAPVKYDREKTQALLQSVAPPDIMYALHLLLIELGRRTCHPRRPEHEGCPLRKLCPSAERVHPPV